MIKSNIPDYIKTSLNWVREFLPDSISILGLPKSLKTKLPVGLSGTYEYYITEIYDKSFIIAGANYEEEISPSVLLRHKEIIQKQTGLVPIFIYDKLVSYLFSRYTKYKIDIIVGTKQLFLPSIFLIYSEYKTDKNLKKEVPPILFQVMVLYQLEKGDINGKSMKELEKIFNTSYASVNRCVRWMKGHGFIRLEGKKEKYIHFNYQGKTLWEKSLPYLQSPIDFILYTPEPVNGVKGYVSEQLALGEYSLLSGGSNRIAISKEEYNTLKKDNILWDKTGEDGVEVWKYDPSLLSDTNIVDKLSLYLILKDYEDERVQIELENMLNEIVW